MQKSVDPSGQLSIYSSTQLTAGLDYVQILVSDQCFADTEGQLYLPLPGKGREGIPAKVILTTELSLREPVGVFQIDKIKKGNLG